MLSDPQTVGADTMPRISSNDTRSIYQKADGTKRFTVSHQKSGNRTRHLIRIDKDVIATDPFSSVDVTQTASVYLVVDEPPFGFTDSDIGGIVATMVGWLSADTYAATYDVLEEQH